MIKIHSGHHSRNVILLFEFAFKFAKNREGRKNNISEAFISASNPFAPITPVFGIFFNGWLLISQRCKACKLEQFGGESIWKTNSEFLRIRSNIIVEPYYQNYGILKSGRIVAFDYHQNA